MATTLTTSSTQGSSVLPSLLDLLVPAATPAGGKTSAAFDALLQPPARPTTASESGRPDEQPERYDHRPESHRPLPPETREQEAQPPREEAAELEPAAHDAPVAVENEVTDELDSAEKEAIAAESLAGLTMCVLPVPIAENAAEGEEAPAAAIERSAGRKANRKGEAAGHQPGVENGPAVVNAEGAAVQTAEHVEANAERAGVADLRDSSALIGSPDLSQEQADKATASAEAAGEAAVVDVALIQPIEPLTEVTPDAREGSQPGEEIELAAATADPASPTSPVSSAATTSETPVVAGAATQVAPVADNASSSSSSPNANGVQTAGSGRRPRLPAELLAHDAGRAARGTATPVDTTRLLTRVARAFAAAQQRDGEIQLRLSPPELGSLKLTLQIQDGKLVARMETETSSAKTAIIENLPALRERLAEQGVRIERFDVDLMQRQPGGMPDRPGDQQREAPQPRAEPIARPRGEAALPVRGMASVAGTTTGLNVIV